MTPAKLRGILRWVHIGFGAVVMCYIYSPFNLHIPFQIFVKFIALPVIVVGGVWIWKFNAFNKFFGIK